MKLKLRKLISMVFVLVTILGLSSQVFVAAGTVEVVTQKDAKMSLGKTLNAQQVQEMKYILGGQTIPDNEIVWVDGNLINQFMKDGTDNSVGVYSSAIIVPKPAGFGVRIQIVTPERINLVTATTYQNAAITSGAKDVLIKIASPIEVTGEGALVGLYAMLQKTGQLQDPKSPKVAQDEIKVINHIRKEYNIYNTNVNVLLADLKLAINKYYINNNVIINDNDLMILVENKFNEAGLDINDPETKKLIEDFLKEYAQTKPAQSRDTYDQLNLSIMTQSWDSLLNGLDKVLGREVLLQEKLPDYSDTKYYHPIFPQILDQLFQAIEADNQESLAKVKAIYDQSFLIEKMLGVPTERERAALNYFRIIAYHYTASKSDGQNPGATKGAWLDSLGRYRALVQEPRLQEIVDRMGLASGLPMEANIYSEFVQRGEWIEAAVNDGQSIAFNPKTQELGSFADGQAEEPKILPETIDFQAMYGQALENKREPITELAEDFVVDEQANKFAKGEEAVAGQEAPVESLAATSQASETESEAATTLEETTSSQETTLEETTVEETTIIEETTTAEESTGLDPNFDFALGSVTEGQTNIDVTVQANQTYKLVFPNGDETQEIVADETGLDSLDFGDPALAPADGEIILLVKVGQDYQEVARTKVLASQETTLEERPAEAVPAPESETEVETSQAESTEAETTVDDFEYQIQAITAGQSFVDVTVQPNQVFQIDFGGGNLTDDIQADETGLMTLDFDDPTLTPEGAEIKLLVKEAEGYKEVAMTTVLPGQEPVTEASLEATTVLEEMPVEESLPEETVAEESMAEELPADQPLAGDPVWNQSKSDDLARFVAEWQVVMDQSYEFIDASQLETDQVQYQGYLLKDLIQEVQIDGLPVTMEWYKADQALTTTADQANLFEAYTDGTHIYLFAYYQGQARVYHADALTADGKLDFKETQNQELIDGFEQVYNLP